jgi:hypothetical protein
MSDKIRLDPQQLTIRDLKRAKAGPLGGRDPFSALEDPLDAATLIAWCVRSRDDPEFTWADAENLDLGSFEHGEDDDQPPLTAPNVADGGRRGSGEPPNFKGKRPRLAPASDSATSSASTGTSTSS